MGFLETGAVYAAAVLYGHTTRCRATAKNPPEMCVCVCMTSGHHVTHRILFLFHARNRSDIHIRTDALTVASGGGSRFKSASGTNQHDCSPFFRTARIPFKEHFVLSQGQKRAVTSGIEETARVFNLKVIRARFPAKRRQSRTRANAPYEIILVRTDSRQYRVSTLNSGRMLLSWK